MTFPSDSIEAGSRVSIRGRIKQKQPLLEALFVSFSIVALQLVQGVLLARLLEPVGRGEYATASFYSQMFLYAGLLGGIESLCRMAVGERGKVAELRRSAFRLGLVTGSLTCLAVLIASALALPAEKRYLFPLACICALGPIASHVSLMLTAVDRGADQMRRYNYLRLVFAASYPALLLLWVCFAPLTVAAASILSVVAAVVGALACLWAVKQPWRGAQAASVRSMLFDGRYYGISMIGVDLFERLDLLLILWLSPLEVQGWYAAMVPAAYPLTVAPNTLGIFLFNKGATAGGGLTRPRFYRMLVSTIAFQTFSVVVFCLVIGTLVRWVYGEAFAPATIFAIWLAPVSAVKGILQGLDAYLRGRGRPLVVVPPRLFATLAMLTCVYFASPSMGAQAIPFSALVGQLICLVWIVWIIHLDSTKNPS